LVGDVLSVYWWSIKLRLIGGRNLNSPAK